MFEYTNCNILNVSVHEVGNKTLEQELKLSDKGIDIQDGRLKELLFKFFLSHFNSEETFSFTFSNGDFNLNPVCIYASDIFESKRTFHKNSINLAKHLYESSLHPNIKPGDFYVVYFSNITIDNEQTDAVGLFKSETKDFFLKLVSDSNSYSLNYDDGINIEKMNKGCIIFNTHQEQGYKLSIIDKSNKAGEAQYWKDIFLNTKPFFDDFHHTQNYLSLAKDFVTDRLTTEFEVTKTDQIEYLNRSLDFFKKNEEFNENKFASEVFGDSAVIKSFKNFKQDFQNDNNLDLVDDFAISSPVVKKQSRIFKKVLKLDKNFHIYIHGNGEIEQGVEGDGRKFYKIYYREES